MCRPCVILTLCPKAPAIISTTSIFWMEITCDTVIYFSTRSPAREHIKAITQILESHHKMHLKFKGISMCNLKIWAACFKFEIFLNPQLQKY